VRCWTTSLAAELPATPARPTTHRSMSDVEHFALIVLITAAAGRGLGALQPGQRTYPGPRTGHLPVGPGDRLRRRAGTRSGVGHQRPAGGDGGACGDPVRRWDAHRLAAVPPAAGAVVWVGVAGTFVTAEALAVLAHVLFGWTGEPRCCWAPRWPYRPGGGVLGAWPSRGRRSQRNHPGGRGRRQRPGRHRAHGQPVDRQPAAQPWGGWRASPVSSCYSWRSAGWSG